MIDVHPSPEDNGICGTDGVGVGARVGVGVGDKIGVGVGARVGVGDKIGVEVSNSSMRFPRSARATDFLLSIYFR